MNERELAKLGGTRNGMIARVMSLSLVLALGACASDAQESPTGSKSTAPDRVAEEPDEIAAVGTVSALTASAPGATVWNVWEGTRSAGAVEILTTQGGCTGVLIGASMILTVAHCWSDGNLNGLMDARIHLALEDGRWRCLTGPDEFPDGKCRGRTLLWFERFDTQAVPAAERDLMAIFTEEVGGRWWGGVAHLAAAGLYSGQLAEPQISNAMFLLGRGFANEAGDGLGVMRSALFSMPYVPASASSINYQALRASDPTACGGDSGGPLEDAYSLGWVVGIHSGRVPQQNLRCGTAAQTHRATKITQSKMRWLNDRRLYNGLDECWTTNTPDSWVCN